MKKYIDTKKLSNVIRTVTSMTRYKGLDENGEAIYDPYAILPTITFTGTVKIHGTNGSIGYDKTTNIIKPISRKQVLDSWVGHMGFCEWLYSKHSLFLDYFNRLKEQLSDKDYDEIIVNGEWYGGSIQKRVAVNELSKRLSPFKICLIKNTEEGYEREWIKTEDLITMLPHSPIDDIYSIFSFKTYEITIDFNNLENVRHELDKLTVEVENECPVGKFFGISGTGEGIVWTGSYKGQELVFKEKGVKHSNVDKSKSIANPIDPIKLKNSQDFVDYAVTRNRVEQGIFTLFENDFIDMTNLGKVIKWTMNDVFKEEMDALVNSDLTSEDVNKLMSKKIVNIYREILKEKELLI